MTLWGNSNRKGGEKDLVTIMKMQESSVWWRQTAFRDAHEMWNLHERHARGTLGSHDLRGVDIDDAVEHSTEYNRSFTGTLETRTTSFLRRHFQRHPGLPNEEMPRRSVKYDKEIKLLIIDIPGTLATCHISEDNPMYGPYQAALEAEAELYDNPEVLEQATEMLGYGKAQYGGFFDVKPVHEPLQQENGAEGPNAYER